MTGTAVNRIRSQVEFHGGRTTMKVSEVMTREVQTIQPDQPVQEAASFMLSADAGSIPVTDGERLIGMITDRDIAVRGVAKGRGPDTPVRDLMSNDVICARIDDDCDDVASKMSEAQVRRLPVIDEQQKLCGIVSLGDLARETDNESAHEALEGVSQPGGQHQQ
jgi:CBS domain-containing protein